MFRDCILRFGEFTLDTRSRSLARDEGLETCLTEMPFKLLVYLLENAQQYIPNQVLMQGMWHDGSPLSRQALDQHFGHLYKVGISPQNGYIERNRRRRSTRFLKTPQVSEGGALEVRPVPPVSVPEAPKSCPYRGLSAFRREDAHLFFGRDATIQRLAGTVRNNRLVCLVGSSGSGKSSLICAGLFPALCEGRPSQAFSSPILFTPGRTPFLNLAISLVRAWASPDQKLTEMIAEADNLAKMLSTGQVPLAVCLTEAGGKPDSRRRVLLVVDQLEELFSLAPEDEQARFLQLILACAEDDLHVHILFAIRGDYYGDAIATQRGFADKVATVPLGRMTRQELSDAIERPALIAGVKFENGLVDRLLDDAEAQSSALPLLGFTLSELWHLSRGSQLTHRHYESIGGIKEVIAQAAEDVYQHADPVQQSLALKTLARLIHVSSLKNPVADTKQSISWVDLNEEERQSIDPFICARLLIVGNEELRDSLSPIQASWPTTVELAHESVWRHWARLQEHLERNREFLSWLQELRGQLATWEGTGRDDAALLRGPLLAEAFEWLSHRRSDLHARESEFIERCARFAVDEDIGVTVATGNRLFRIDRHTSWLEVLACWAGTQAIDLTLSQRDETDALPQLIELAQRFVEIGCNEGSRDALNRILTIRRDRKLHLDSKTERYLSHVLWEAGMRPEAKAVMRDIRKLEERVAAAVAICEGVARPDGEALAVAEEAGTLILAANETDYWQPNALGALGIVFHRMGVAQVSAELASKAVSILDLRARNSKLLFNEISAALKLGIAFAEGGLEQRAEELVLRALRLIGTDTDSGSNSHSLTQAAEILWAIGCTQPAKKAIEDALIAAERDDTDHSVWALQDIARVCIARGNPNDADRALNEVVKRSTAFPFGPRLELWGWAASQRGKLQQSEAMSGLVEAMLESARNPSMRVFAMCTTARSLFTEGPSDLARDLLLLAASAAAEVNDSWSRAICLAEIGHLLDTGGWKGDSVGPTVQASAQIESAPAVPNGVMALTALAAGLQRLDETEMANQVIDEALKLADRTRPTHDSPVPYPQIAMVLAKLGRYKNARSAADRAGKAWSQLMGYTAVLSESLSVRLSAYREYLPALYIAWERRPMVFADIPSHRERRKHPSGLKLIRRVRRN